MAQKDISEFVQSVTIEDEPVSFVTLEIGKLEVRPGDVLVMRRADGVQISRGDAAKVREVVLRAFEKAGFEPAILFVDGFELAVIRGRASADGRETGDRGRGERVSGEEVSGG